jgi:hypothetical protein
MTKPVASNEAAGFLFSNISALRLTAYPFAIRPVMMRSLRQASRFPDNARSTFAQASISAAVMQSSSVERMWRGWMMGARMVNSWDLKGPRL